MHMTDEMTPEELTPEEIAQMRDEANAASEAAIAEGYEGNPPPGEWVQSPDAEVQLDGVPVAE
jgi:hypothetical protein